MRNKTQSAFEKYMNDQAVQQAIQLCKVGDLKLLAKLLEDCFMRGALYATAGCEAEHHQPKERGS